MTKTVRARYTLEFKQEAVRLVEGGQSIAAAARTLGVVDQTLFESSVLADSFYLLRIPIKPTSDSTRK